MAITALAAMKLSDTFNTLKDRINEIITKVNKVDLEQNRLVLTTGATAPIADADMAANTAMLWVDDSANVKITIDVAGTRTTYTITKT
tara:strand:+ start:404 stop:667 length:264 start_codon:yes stop_codon:yes gene_type:complete